MHGETLKFYRIIWRKSCTCLQKMVNS